MCKASHWDPVATAFLFQDLIGLAASLAICQPRIFMDAESKPNLGSFLSDTRTERPLQCMCTWPLGPLISGNPCLATRMLAPIPPGLLPPRKQPLFVEKKN